MVEGAARLPYTLDAMRIARRYLVVGRVQGVGFRYFAQQRAGDEGLDGWVRNTSDGDVEVEAAGDIESLTRFEQHLRVGPRGARVDRVDTANVAAAAAPVGFRVRS